MTKDEAFKRGMELLRSNISAQQWFELQPEITAIKDALAQPEQEPVVCCGDYATCMKPCTPRGRWLAEQEPVATVTSETGNPDVTMSWWHEPALPVGTKLYTTPPKRPWVGLTKREVETLAYKAEGNTWTAVELAEAKLKELNT